MLLLDKHVPLTGKTMLIDVGCGPGRLARYLKGRRDLAYLGTDVVPQLLDVARVECGRPDWSFKEVTGFQIPATDASADGVAIFSVFTNIYPEQSYLLTMEAARVLKPNGRLLISYMDIGHERHQATFKDLTVHWQKRLDPLVFLDETFLTYFARSARLRIVAFVPPTGAQCDAPAGARLLDGREIEGPLGLGQTLCLMEKVS
jgi:ubiquinone/menaquinone biosynthesis C-methylase UbiE